MPTRVTERATYAVAGGNHVTLLLDRSRSASALQPGPLLGGALGEG